MRLPRVARRARRRRRESPSGRMREATRKVRAQVTVSRPPRGSGPRSASVDALVIRARGVLLEARRRLRPAGRAVLGAIARVAHPIVQTLFVVLRIPVALIAIGLDLVLDLGRWLRGRIGPLAAAASVGLASLSARVTPVRALAVVTVVVSAALAASQFADYRGVAVGSPQYPADIARVAPPPQTDLKATGSAHFYALVPAALLAVVLTWLTVRGRWQLGRAIALVGVAGIAVALLVDRPAGLDAGTAGIAYLGTEAELLEGFWAEIAASVGLIICGPLLGWYVRQAAGESRRARRRSRRERQARTTATAMRPRGAEAGT